MGGAEIVPGVHRIDTPLGNRVNSLYLFVGDRAAMLFDTGIDGTSTTHLLPYLRDIGLQPEMVRAVVVSHCDVDHFGGLADARRAFPHALFCAHLLDAPLMCDYSVYERQRARGFLEEYGLDEDPVVLAWTRQVADEAPVDLMLAGGERFDLGQRYVEIVHLPGHTLGHLGVHDPERGVAAVGDAVLGAAVPFADGTAAFPPTYRHVEQYLATVRLLESMDAQWLLTAHYPTMRDGDARRFLTRSREFVEALDEAVRADLGAHGPSTLEDLLGRVNDAVRSWPGEGTSKALAFPVVGHLERMLSGGIVRRVAGSRSTLELTS